MSPDDARSLGELVVLGALGGYTAWKSRKAAKQTVATGNGFAKFVKDSLTEIKTEVKATNKKIDDHLQAHANADVMNRPRRSNRDLTEL